MVMTYLSQEGVQRAARYKYIGRDKSLIYAHIGSPLAQWCVDHLLPTWIAPNLVTLLGLVLLLITFSACAVLNPNLTVDGVPSHICILAAVTLTAYSILDNMDGKQARKTGTSSPLGLLFDHGCDALNATVLGPLTLFSAVGLSAASWAAPLGWSLAATGFYVSTWEEFHTGEFELPLINGPNEGIVIFVLGYLASAVLGPEWWHTPCCEVGGVTLMPLHGLLGFFAVALVATLTDSVTIILNRAHQPRNLTAEEVAAGMRVDVSMCAAWGRMLPVAAYWGVAFAGHYLAPHVVNWCPFLWYTTLGVAFTVLVTKLMLSHVAVEPFRPALVPLVALALIPAVATLRSQGLLHVWSETEDIAVYVALALLVWALSAHHIVTSIITLSVGLDVPVFTIRPKAH